MILGRTLEQSVQQALKISGADLMIFIKQPISATLLGRCPAGHVDSRVQMGLEEISAVQNRIKI